MSGLSLNQEASLRALRQVTTDSGVACASKAAWKQACPAGISVHPAAMLKTGAVLARKAVVSINGKVIELYSPAEAAAA